MLNVSLLKMVLLLWALLCCVCAASAASSANCCLSTPIKASCFGFHLGGNNTAFLQAAVNSCGNKSFTIDNVPGSNGLWTLEGIETGKSKYTEEGFGVLFNASNQVVTLEKGVTLQARRGYFAGIHDSLVVVRGADNFKLVGEGSNALEMWKQDYNNASLYKHSEWRHGITIGSSHGVEISNLLISNTGGDGIDICCSTTDVFVSQVHSVEANRNGMSLTGVSNLTVLDSSFKFTSGTCCMSGLDLEPEITSEVCNDITFRNVEFSGNAMNQVTLSLYGQQGITDNILFDNVTVANGTMAGFIIAGYSTAGPLGTLRLNNVNIFDLGDAGFYFQRNGSSGQAIELNDVWFNNTATQVFSMFGHWPLEINGGGVTLTNVVIHDPVARPFLYGGWEKPFFASAVTGDVTVYSNSTRSCSPYFNNASSTGNSVKVTCNAMGGAAAPGGPAAVPPFAAPVASPQRTSKNTEPYGDPASGCMDGEAVSCLLGRPILPPPPFHAPIMHTHTLSAPAAGCPLSPSHCTPIPSPPPR